jgi:mannose-6-phosphate isomerase-like protein (cupin superfamily)
MSLGIYVLLVGGTDNQHPHASDEVYVVLRGRGSLQVQGRDREVRQGSVVSVDHGEEHRFVDITEDLHVLVIFAPPDDPD